MGPQKALYRVSDGWIFNAPCEETTVTSHEKDLIEIYGLWDWFEIPEGMTITELKRHKVVASQLELLPEEQWPDYCPPEEDR